MNKAGLTLFICSCILIAGWLWQQSKECEYPVHYRIGRVDSQFDNPKQKYRVSEREYRNAIQEAADLWEKALGRPLFTYDPTADFTINLIYDERQQATVDSQVLARKIKHVENSNDQVLGRYDYWKDIYDTKSKAYEKVVNNFEAGIKAYNNKVDEWNKKGGVPEDQVGALNAERNALDQLRADIDAKHGELEQIRETLSSLQGESSTLVAAYNSNVRTYNALHGVKTPFNKGVYDGDSISVFQYHDEDDLRLVLAHEMGHALGVDHVERAEAIMHAMMGAQNLDDLTPTATDIQAVKAVCPYDD